MRADRLIAILLLLQNKGKLTTKELAEQLEVTPRTVHRDMESLSASGIPVVADRGKSGGWRLLEKYKTNLTGLKANELKSLFISPSVQLLSDLGITQDWNDAREKLLASIPASFHQEALDVWDRIHVDTSSWRQSPEKTTAFRTLQEAIWEERKLQILYERADGEAKERVVNPLGLVAKGSTWYLIASVNEDIRNYRISRITSAVKTEDAFTRPADFNLAQYWESSTKSFMKALPTYETEVELSPSIVPRIKFTGRFMQNIKLDAPLNDRWVPATICFDTEQEAAEFILGFSNQVRVIRPENLKQKVYVMAKAVVKMVDYD
ncbi:helix-turn-helix transcriptional regulator [Fictibacillus terranigra]|uniref:YafY family protein n=1 Tax=Fictibacillus terranigra TaxID=3058424 RepID=A0ABT8EAW8_9BACL|nr:YafY family protein [Fictibacillus sp. CENA-BCM004]MDN4075027.1 YafY family protein [Fictibacillus sp. CENA-BCM004]